MSGNKVENIQLVLVTGANGVLGANVVKQLIIASYRVRVIVRKGSIVKGIDDLDCEVFYGNICKDSDLEKAIVDCNYIIHCAAKTSQKSNNLQHYLDINVEVVRKLIRLSKAVGITRFIHISSTNCFTNGTLENPGNETGTFMPWLKNSAYAYSKFLAQELVLSEVKINNFPAVVLAPSFIVGPRDSKISSGQLIMYALKSRIVFYPEGGKSFVDAEFAAVAIVNSLTKGRIGEIYLLAGENLPLKIFLQKVARITNRKILLVRIPQIILLPLVQLFTFLNKIFALSLSLTKVNLKLISLENYFSGAKANKELDLKPTNTDEAILKSIDWYKEKGYLGK